MPLSFTWDERKNEENIRKHGVSCEEAKTVFKNFPLEIFYDPEHSESEDRYLAIGFCDQGQVLVVVHTENSQGTQIRIISARRATSKEKHTVFGGNR